MEKPIFTVEQLERIEQAICAQEFRSHAIAYDSLTESSERERHEAISADCYEIRQAISEYLNEIEVQNEVKNLHEGIAKLLS